MLPVFQPSKGYPSNLWGKIGRNIFSQEFLNEERERFLKENYYDKCDAYCSPNQTIRSIIKPIKEDSIHDESSSFGIFYKSNIDITSTCPLLGKVSGFLNSNYTNKSFCRAESISKPETSRGKDFYYQEMDYTSTQTQKTIRWKIMNRRTFSFTKLTKSKYSIKFMEDLQKENDQPLKEQTESSKTLENPEEQEIKKILKNMIKVDKLHPNYPFTRRKSNSSRFEGGGYKKEVIFREYATVREIVYAILSKELISRAKICYKTKLYSDIKEGFLPESEFYTLKVSQEEYEYTQEIAQRREVIEYFKKNPELERIAIKSIDVALIDNNVPGYMKRGYLKHCDVSSSDDLSSGDDIKGQVNLISIKVPELDFGRKKKPTEPGKKKILSRKAESRRRLVEMIAGRSSSNFDNIVQQHSENQRMSLFGKSKQTLAVFKPNDQKDALDTPLHEIQQDSLEDIPSTPQNIGILLP